MPRKRVFLCLWYAGTDILQSDENHKKTGKTEHESMKKVQESKPGKSFQVRITFMLRLSESTLKNNYLARLALGLIFPELARMVLKVLWYYTIGPWILIKPNLKTTKLVQAFYPQSQFLIYPQ